MAKPTLPPLTQPRAASASAGVPGRRSEKEFLSTSEVARLLGVAIGTVQRMVESGALPAWKTGGGHRRIDARKVRELLAASRSAQHPPDTPAALVLLIAEDDALMRSLYQKKIARWRLPIDLHLVDDGFAALIEAGRQRPDVMIVDLHMEGMDGFELIRRVTASRTLRATRIIVATGLDAAQIHAAGGLPPGITVLNKPLSFSELSGFMRACLHQRQGAAGAAP